MGTPRNTGGRPARRAPFLHEPLEGRRLLAATLIHDLDTRPGNDFRPLLVTESADVAYFSANDGQHGVELWRSDGTAGGTRLLKDIHPGPRPSLVGYLENSVVDAAGTLFFSADDGQGGVELWKSDGTEAGTVLVADIRPGPASSYPAQFVAVGASVYFFADDGSAGRELWHSDGTPQGTSIVKDIRAGAAGQVQRLGAALPDGTFFFYATNGTNSGLWKTDGTAGGTIYLKGSAERLLATSTPMVASGGYMYIPDAVGGLWRSDGTPAGTVELEAGNSITGYVTEMEDVGGRLYYVRAISPSNDRTGSLWVWAGGTSTRITNSGSATNFTRAGGLTNVNGTLYFAASTSATGRELWRLPAGATAATMVRDATPGTTGSDPIEITGAAGTVYFTAGSALRGYALWRSNGTSAGTTLVATLNAGTPLEAPNELTAVGGRVLFVNDGAATGPELWSSGGTAATTGLVADIYPGTRWSQPFFWGAIGDRILFNASTPETAIELWATDGTPGGVTLLADINPGPESTNPGPLRILGDVAYFTAYTAATGNEPWVTDGTPGGTRRLIDLRPGSQGSDPGGYVRLGDTVYFIADDGVRGYELWKTDGTAQGTTIVKDIVPGAGGASPADLVVSGGKLYFTATIASSGSELWVSDDSETGTVLLKDIRPGTAGSNPARLADAGGTLYFAANGGSGIEPWKTDGTPDGTVQLKDIRAGSGDSSPSLFTAAGGVVYFVAADSAAGNELWKTDGTAGGTVLVKDLRPGTTGSSIITPVAMNGRLFFIADNGTTGRELWSSAGTAETTAVLKDIYPGTGHGVLTGLTVANGRLFFAADDSVHGYEIWSTDGTPAGTTMLEDLAPGLFPGTRGRPVAGRGGTLYFEGNNGVTGFEPFKLNDIFAPYVWNAAFETQGPHAVVFQFNEDVSAPDAGSLRVLDAGTRQPVAAGTIHVAYNILTRTATFDFPDLPDGRLPPGDYVAVLAAGAVSDSLGNALAGEYRLPFTAGAPAARVTGRWVFYNGSALDGRDPAAAPSDDGAIAADKNPLLPGQGSATFANYTTYSRGINGLMVDVAGLPLTVTPTAPDFDLRVWDGVAWLPAPALRAVDVRRGAGAEGSDRVTLTFADNAVQNTWLKITMKATARTGLATPDVFSFGNLIGDTGGPGALAVDAADMLRTRLHFGRKEAAALDRYDFNRDGVINASDLLIVRRSQRAGVALAGAKIAAVPAPAPAGRPSRRTAWITASVLRA